LTGFVLRFFFIPPMPMVWSTMQFHFPDADPSEPIAQFAPEAREAKPTPIQGTLL
jgi:hypothetical protein